jgi:transcriptional regulator with GAF, ATPase, and Fis domain
LRDLTDAVLGPTDPAELLYRLTDHAVTTFDAAAAGLLLADGGGELWPTAASDERAAAAERHQSGSGSGPCYEAATSTEVVHTDDLVHDTRWPDYRERVRELGFRAILGVPVRAGGRTIGAMNVYRDQPTGWRDADLADATTLARMVAACLVHPGRWMTGDDVTAGLRSLQQATRTIEHATSRMVARDGSTVGEATARLRATARRDGVHLVEAARRETATGG